jgi:4-amino-4-deoxy-L-arabinose transferase-like glycosyltransferase
METRSLAVLTIAAALASFFLYLGRPPLFDVDEGAFSQATLEMFQRGDFLSTYLNGVPRYDKPILVYWLQAAGVLAFGPTEFAFRLPSALCGTLWCALVFAFARRAYGLNVGLAAAAIAATSVGVFAIARAATADALLNLLIAVSMFGAWLYLQSGERKWLYAAFAAAGLGVLAKGPVAVLIPGAVTFLFCLIRRDFRTWLRAIFDWRGLLLFAAIAVPWYAIILAKEGWAFIDGFVMKHNVQRFGSTLQSHGGSLVYYFPVVLVATLPHTGLFLRVFAKVRDAWRDDLQCYLILWFAFVFVFFSFSGTKLPHYVLYGLSGMFVLMGLHANQAPARWWLVVPMILFMGLLLALPALVEHLAARTHDGYYDLALADAGSQFPGLYYVYTGVAALFLLWLALVQRVEAPYKVAATGTLTVTLLAAFVLPAAGALLQEPVKRAALLARARHYDVVMWGINVPSFSVYYGRPTPGGTPRPGDVVITRSKRLPELPPFETIYMGKGVALVRIKG